MDTTSFPDPIEAQDVGGDCLVNPSLVGTGDCSNTIESQFQQSGWKYDYQEIRLSVTVPADALALAFDVAYFTTEWPVFAGQNSTVQVVPGDEIELVFAIFDLDDVNLDSFVFLDNFRWLCEGDGGPTTVPVE